MKAGKHLGLLWMGALLLSIPIHAQAPTRTQLESPLVDERTYVGNIYGSVLDAATHQHIPMARIYVYDPDAIWSAAHDKKSAPATKNLRSDAFDHPQATGIADEDGNFLIPGIPTPYPYRVYTVVAIATDYSMEIIDRVRVFPGASMALQIDFRLDHGSELPIFYHGDDPAAPYRYRQEETAPESSMELPFMQALPASAPNFAGPFASNVFATREGLVGGTTANGHVIVPNDHFVALPSRRALCSNGGNEFQVEISVGAKTAVMPQWDIGPWNIRDDYWNPASVREKFQDLAQGMPEAQAAYQTGYNGGNDGGDTSRGPRKVLNPAGIDLADGTFWQDLQLPDNSFITVKFLWLVNYALSAGTGRTVTSAASAAQLRTGSALITSNAGQVLPEAFLLFSNSVNGVMTSEATVPSVKPLQSGFLSVDLSSNTDTLVSMANPSSSPVDVTLTLLNTTGQTALPGQPGSALFTRTLTLPARAQQAVAFSTLIQSPSGPATFQGAALIQAAAPVFAIGLRTVTNSRSETLTTTLPVTDASQPSSRETLSSGKSESSAAMPPYRSEETLSWFPVIKDGGGLSTIFELNNPLEVPVSGTVLFFDNDGQPLSLTLDVQPQTSFRYSLAARGSLQKITVGGGTATRSGYALILPDQSSPPPQGNVILSSSQNGIVVTQAGMAAVRPQSSFAVYLDRRASRDTSVSLVNPSLQASQVRMRLVPLDATQTLYDSSITLPPQQRIELVGSMQFSGLPVNFEGILRVDGSTRLVPAAVHLTGNDRGETLFSVFPIFATTAAPDLPSTLTIASIPYLEDGAGHQSQLVLMNPDPAAQRSGTVNLFTPVGTTLNLAFR